MQPINVELLQNEKRLIDKVLKLRRTEESILLQRSKQQFIKLTDSNTSYFYSSLRTQHARTKIQGLEDDHGAIVKIRKSFSGLH